MSSGYDFVDCGVTLTESCGLTCVRAAALRRYAWFRVFAILPESAICLNG